MLSMTQNQVRKSVVSCVKAGIIPFVQGNPGIGKSSIIQAIADEQNLALIDVRLSQLQPYDLNGLIYPHKEETTETAELPEQPNKATYLPVSFFPLENTPIPEGKDGFLLFFDEFNSATKEVFAACYKILTDRAIGEHKLHEKCHIVCAGNLMTDKAITHTLPSTILSRLVHMKMELNPKEWLEWAGNQTKVKFHPMVLAFLNYRNECVLHMPKNFNEVTTFATPRTWEFMSKILFEFGDISTVPYALIQGTVGETVAADFNTFLDCHGKIPSYAEIISDPESALIPDSPALLWAVSGMLQSNIKKEDYNKVATYLNRFAYKDITKTTFRQLTKRDIEFAIIPEVMAFLEANKAN